MPKVKILPRKTAFIYGTLYRAGGVALIKGERNEDNPDFSAEHMKFVDNDTPVSIRGSGPVTVGPRSLPAEEAIDETVQQIKDAVGRLDHSDDAHWTKKDSKPDLRVLSEYAGIRVSRKQLDALFPGLVRVTE